MAHEHNVIDADKHFKIDPTTREITNESGKLVLMQHDHNSERFTFEVPRYVDGHDMSLCNLVQIHYQNKETITNTVFDDVYEASDFKVDTVSDNIVTFSWLISSNATQYVGQLNFSVRFVCVADDGTVEYVWNTAVHYGVTVSTCFYNSEEIAAAYSDTLAKWGNDLAKWRDDLYLASVGEGVTVEEVRALLGIVAVKTEKVTLSAANWANNVQIVNVDGVTNDNLIVVTHAPESYEDYIEKDVRCSAQASGTLTFTSAISPTVDIKVNVAIFG